jgi:hypothetical protein
VDTAETMAGAVDGCRLDLPGEPLTATGSPYPNRSSMPPPGSTLTAAWRLGGGRPRWDLPVPAARRWLRYRARWAQLEGIACAFYSPQHTNRICATATASSACTGRCSTTTPGSSTAAPGRVEPDRTGLLVATPGSSATWASPMPDPRHLADVQVHRAGRQCAEPVRHWRAPRCSASTASTPPAHFPGWLEARHRRRAERWPGRLNAVASARRGRVGHVNRIPLGWSRPPARRAPPGLTGLTRSHSFRWLEFDPAVGPCIATAPARFFTLSAPPAGPCRPAVVSGNSRANRPARPFG